MQNINRKILLRNGVRLEPLSISHAHALHRNGSDTDIWQYLPGEPLDTLTRSREFVEQALQAQRDGLRFLYAVIDVNRNEAVGTTSYLALRNQHRSIEIGWTWLGKRWQRTHFNTTCKWLMINQAFDQGFMRVEFKTDSRNNASQTALQRLGATREGTLRKHMINPDGYVRDSVYYSIVDSDWPQLGAHLKELMAARQAENA